MNLSKCLKAFILATLLSSCGSDAGDEESSLNLEIDRTEYQLGENIKANITGGHTDSVVYYLGEQRLKKTTGNEPLNHTFANEKLGKWNLIAKIYSNGKMQELSEDITLLNNTAPVIYGYEVINSYPHSPDAYTQGLEFHNNELYESTGQYGSSSLRKVDLETGEVLKSIKIPDTYFAEGISILNDKIHLLTWKSKIGFIYDLETFEKVGDFGYQQSKEGWGLTNNGTKFYKSDGTEKIWLLNPQTLAEESFIQVTTDRKTYSNLNELEWVEGKIYGNFYQENGVAIINPANGAIEGVINFSGLREQLGTPVADPLNHVLNGIAYNPNTKKLYVTGKDWDKLFEVKIVEK